MAEKTSVLVKLDPEVKERWDSHSESTAKYSSLSHFIRFSVQSQIQRDNSEGEDQQDQSIKQAKNQILSEIDDLDKTVNRVDNKMVSSEESRKQYESTRKRIEDLDKKWTRTLEYGADHPAIVEETVRDIKVRIANQLNRQIETINGEEVSFDEIYEDIDLGRL